MFHREGLTAEVCNKRRSNGERCPTRLSSSSNAGRVPGSHVDFPSTVPRKP